MVSLYFVQTPRINLSYNYCKMRTLTILLLCIGLALPLKVLRNKTASKHVSLSKYGKRVVLSGKKFQNYEWNGNQYIFTEAWDNILSNQTGKLEQCCKPKFSENQNYVYYIQKHPNGSNGLFRKRLLLTLHTSYVSNISQSYPHFNKNHQYLIVFLDDKIQIYKENELKKSVNPYPPILYTVPQIGNPSYIRSIDISEDGQVIGVLTTSNQHYSYRKFYFYYTNRSLIFERSFNFQTEINQQTKGYVWEDQRSILLSNSTQFQIHQFNGSNSYSSDFVYKNIDSYRMIISGNKEYICFVSKEQNSLLPFISKISLYPFSQFNSTYEENNNLTVFPDLLIYEVGDISSIQINYNGSEIVYIREDQNEDWQFVAVFHELGQHEVVYPCYTKNYKNMYSYLCNQVDEEVEVVQYTPLQICIFVIVFLNLIFMIIMIVCFFIRSNKVQNEKKEDEKKKEEEVQKLKSKEEKNMKIQLTQEISHSMINIQS